MDALDAVNKKIQALEAMSTPVRDAKRIPAASNGKRSTSLHDEDLTFSGKFIKYVK